MRAWLSGTNDFTSAPPQGTGKSFFSQEAASSWAGEGGLKCLSAFSPFLPQDLHHLGHQQLVPPWAGATGAKQCGRDAASPEPKPLPQGHFNGNAGKNCTVPSWVTGSAVTARWLRGWTCCSSAELDLKSSRDKP